MAENLVNVPDSELTEEEVVGLVNQDYATKYGFF